MWTKIAGIILRNRIAFITGVLLGTVFMGFQARHIQMSYESADLLPKTDTAYLDYAKFRETFGQEGNIMVFGIQDSNFYELAKINLNKKKILSKPLTNQIQQCTKNYSPFQ